jgi:hypothetical protein
MNTNDTSIESTLAAVKRNRRAELHAQKLSLQNKVIQSLERLTGIANVGDHLVQFSAASQHGRLDFPGHKPIFFTVARWDQGEHPNASFTFQVTMGQPTVNFGDALIEAEHSFHD